MRLTMKEKQKITQQISKRYQRARKKEKSKILDEFVEVTGYNRAYASNVLNNWGKKIYRRIGGESVVFVLGKRKRKKRQPRKRYYDEEVEKPLKKIWAISRMLCGKLLKKYIDDNLELLVEYEEISLNNEQKKKLYRISPATIDRLLKKERKRLELKARKGTKPGTLLKSKIPIRTYCEWDENRVGFMEMDLVSHNGGNPAGEFNQTLDCTDVKTGWTETRAVKNKAQVYVFNALKHIREKIPFELLGLDSDNGGEFINDQLHRYCEEEEITFTRSRPQRKNDNCFVEQKNYSVVRRTVGYQRYEGPECVNILNEIYDRVRLRTNYFTPTMKLVKKERSGSKVKRIYDSPMTPYERVLRLEEVDVKVKERLKRERKKLNPAQLSREILDWQEKLFKASKKVKRMEVRGERIIAQSGSNFVYIR